MTYPPVKKKHQTRALTRGTAVFVLSRAEKNSRKNFNSVHYMTDWHRLGEGKKGKTAHSFF